MEISDEIDEFIHLNDAGKVHQQAGKLGLLIREGRWGAEELREAFSLLLSRYVLLLLSNMHLKEEFSEMKAHFEEILKKRETAEKLASLGTVAAGLAHEIKNPLVSIKTLAQLLPERFDDPEFRENFTKIAIDEVDRINDIVSDLLDFAKSSELRFESLHIETFIREIVRLLSSQFAKKGISIRESFADGLPPLWADPSRMKQVLLNLFINGMEAMPNGGEIVVEALSVQDTPGEDKVVVKIADTGVGIREEDKAHLFEPFFTTKGSGTGLGLSICKRIIEEHRGEISIDSKCNEGTMVTLALSAAPKEKVNLR